MSEGYWIIGLNYRVCRSCSVGPNAFDRGNRFGLGHAYRNRVGQRSVKYDSMFKLNDVFYYKLMLFIRFYRKKSMRNGLKNLIELNNHLIIGKNSYSDQFPKWKWILSCWEQQASRIGELLLVGNVFV